MQRVSPHKFVGILIALCIFEGLMSIALYQGLTHAYAGANDFFVVWRATQTLTVEGRNPYTSEVTRDIQQVLFGPQSDDPHAFGFSLFAYPLIIAVPIAPLALLPYDAAEAVWLSLSLTLILLALICLAPKLPPRQLALYIVFGLLFYPTARSLILGQTTVIVFAAFAIGLWALRTPQRFDWLAGFAFAFTTIKPQMSFLCLPIVLLWALEQRRFAILKLFTLTLIVLGLVSFIWLPSWPLDFLTNMRAYYDHTDVGSPTSILLGESPWRVLADLLLLAALGSLAWQQWRARWTQWEMLIYFGLIAAQLIAPRTATANQIVLLIPLSAWLRAAARWQQTALMLVLLFAPWIIFLSTVHGNFEQPPAYLFLPFFTLALWLLHWSPLMTPLMARLKLKHQPYA